MPCGQICKEIVDNQAAVVRQLQCMSNSLLLAASGDGPFPTPEMAKEFQQRSEALARCAAAIEAHVNPPHAADKHTDNPSGGGTL